MLKSQLDTPSLILDIDLFEKNLITMRDYAASFGKKLRPHAKTHKCPEIAKRQLSCGNCIGICAAKLSEAEGLASSGIQDILITSPISAPWKMDKVAALNHKISNLQIVVDHPLQVKMLANIATKENPIHVLIDTNPEFGRTGVEFKDALEFGKMIAQLPNIILDGVQCYAGHLQHITLGDERNNQSTRLMKMGAQVFNELRSLYPTCQIFTGTGTGTSAADLLIDEVTDIQVGSYCMMDSEYLAVEHTGPQYAAALRMISSVISCHHAGHATIDAGTKAIYVTPGAPARVINNNTFDERFTYDWNFGDEHGHLTFAPDVKVNLGERFELVVSHCDPTVNLFDELWITKGDEVIDCWKISLRGCCR
jgi:D-serine deaminase-like pyridoxal phosphate-dependent protein